MDYPVRTPRQLGQILRGIRKARGITQVKLAAEARLLPKTVSLLETNPEKSSTETLLKALTALRIDLVLRDSSSAPPTSQPEW